MYSALLQQQLRSVLGKSSEPLDRGVLSLLLLVQFMVRANITLVTQPADLHVCPRVTYLSWPTLSGHGIGKRRRRMD